MKKLTLLCLEQDREPTLDALKALGVMHLVPLSEASAGNGLATAREKLRRSTAVLNALTSIRSSMAEPPEEPVVVTASPDEVVERVQTLQGQIKQLTDQREELLREKQALEPYGQFDPDLVARLEKDGISVRLFEASARDELVAPEGTSMFEIGHDASNQYVAIVGQAPFEFDAKEFALPASSLSELDAGQQRVQSEIEAAGRELETLSASVPSLEQHAEELSGRVEYLEAHEGMGSSGKLSYLGGFCPVDRVDSIREAAKLNGWGLVVDTPSDDDAVPTLVRYPAWLRMVQPVFRFLGITPGYRETDISSAFLLFLSIFFAMIVGDAGYGLLFLILTPYFRKTRFADAPAEPFRLLYTFSICTVGWGLLTGNYFGIDFALLPPFLQALRVNWLMDPDNSMTFSLLLGALHLTIAHGWKVVRFGRDARALAQAGWIAVVWSIFALARMLLVEAPLPVWFAPLVITGVIAIVLGAIMRKLWMDLGLLALDLVSCFGDLMSYLRLFALGIASVKVAEAFNGMAGDLGFALAGAGIPGVVLAAAAMAFVLAIGHGLNIILCAMSVLVHGVRLNALEFSLHIGQEWSGFDYNPFRTRGKAATSELR